MFWDYITAVANASWQFAKGGGEMIEFLICGIVFFIPKFWKKYEESDIQFEQSLRKIFIWKFTNNDKWRFFVVCGGCFIFHILIIAPYQVYKTTRAENPETGKIVQWQPPEVSKGTMNCNVWLAGNQRPVFVGFNDATNNHGDIIPIRDTPALTVHFTKKRVYIDVDIPTKTKPIQIRAGISTPLPEGWDWNCDSNTLEVVDDQNQAIYQESHLEHNIIQIRGYVQVGGFVFPVTENSLGDQPEPHGHFNSYEYAIGTIFKYPSVENKGIRIGQ